VLAVVVLGSALITVACEQEPEMAGVTSTARGPTAGPPASTVTIAPQPKPTKTSPPATATFPPSVEPATPTEAPPTAVGSIEPTETEAPPSPSPTLTRVPVPTLPPVPAGLIRHGDRNKPLVALTFDACQTAEAEAGYDTAIIRTLTETQTAATLFLGGLWMQSHPTQTQLLANIPYFELGNHSWSHPDFAAISTEMMAAEITKTQEILCQLTGQAPPAVFRLPYGTYTEEALQVIGRHGLRTIQWDVVTGDPDPNILAADIVRAVKNEVQNGSIIIMHMNTRGWHTAEALPTIIEVLKARGYQFVTVSELLESTPPALGNGIIKGTQVEVNVRQAPTTEAAIVGTLKGGTRIVMLCSVVGQMVDSYETDVWYRVEYEGEEAYILSALVAPDEDVGACE
jgi:peptidoglycan/xylan/chitin deacetylase (PgdA/CDA1 family)